MKNFKFFMRNFNASFDFSVDEKIKKIQQHSIKLRQYNEEDIPLMLEIGESAFNDERDGSAQFDRTLVTDSLKYKLSKRNSAFVIEFDNEIVGGVSYTISNNYLSARRQIALNYIYIKKENRSRQLLKILMKQISQLAIQNSCVYTWWAFDTSERLSMKERLAMSFGFSILGDILKYDINEKNFNDHAANDVDRTMRRFKYNLRIVRYFGYFWACGWNIFYYNWICWNVVLKKGNHPDHFETGQYLGISSYLSARKVRDYETGKYFASVRMVKKATKADICELIRWAMLKECAWILVDPSGYVNRKERDSAAFYDEGFKKIGVTFLKKTLL